MRGPWGSQPLKDFWHLIIQIYTCNFLMQYGLDWYHFLTLQYIPVPINSREWNGLIPVPEFWKWIFSFPPFSQILVMSSFIPFFVPKLWEWILFIPFAFLNFGSNFFSFPFCSRSLGIEFLIPDPAPEFSKVIPAHPCLSQK